jgi:hypothetical protein
MAAIAASATREEKQDWLMRPFKWAYNSVGMGCLYVLLHFLDKGSIGTHLSLYAAVATIPITFGLLLWGFRRVHLAARGR